MRSLRLAYDQHLTMCALLPISLLLGCRCMKGCSRFRCGLLMIAAYCSCHRKAMFSLGFPSAACNHSEAATLRAGCWQPPAAELIWGSGLRNTDR